MIKNISPLKHIPMNSKIHFSIVQIIISTFIFLSANVGFTQKVDTVTYNGVSYFEYPFQITTNANGYYYYGMKVRKFKKFMTIYYRENQGKDLSNKDFKRDIKLFKKELRVYKKTINQQNQEIDKNLRKAIDKNPYPLLEMNYQFDKDITPCLDKIPDGKYIQYFSDFALVNETGNYEIVSKKIAGIFSIKNNMLDGDAVWFNFHGDTLKKGKFTNGLKDGEWKIETRNLKNQRITKEDKEFYIANGFPRTDTIIEIVNFSNGLKSGYYYNKTIGKYPIFEGEFLNDVESGSWIERELNITYDDEFNEIIERDNKVVTAEYTIEDKKKVVKQPIVRFRLINADDTDIEDYNFDFTYAPYDLSVDLAEINFTKLPEAEEENYAEGDEEYYDEEGDYMGDDYYSEEGLNYTHDVYDAEKDKYIKRGKVIDSLGFSFKYKGIYERHYPNGQLMFRYEFKDGKLLKEDTIFWDNGKPYDIVTYLPDSNQFLQTIYDYDGKLFHEIIFDSLGDFKKMKFEPATFKTFMIDGLEVKAYNYREFFEYDKMDSIRFFTEKDSVILWKSWSREDTTILYSRIYFPNEHLLKMNGYAVNGTNVNNQEIVFGEKFDNWTGFNHFHFQNLTLKSTQSASQYNNFDVRDSIPINNVNEFSTNFEVATADVLFKDSVPFSGKIAIQFNAKSPKLNISKSINIAFPATSSFSDKLITDYAKYKENGQSKYDYIYNFVDASELASSNFDQVTYSLLPFFLDYIYQPQLYQDDYYGEDYEAEAESTPKIKEKDIPVFSKTLEGKYLNGKPEGIWKVKDQFGKLLFEVPFLNGEIDGVLKTYSYAEPAAKGEDEYYEESTSWEELPKKKTHFLETTTIYKKGLKQGAFLRYNWKGEIEQSEYYLDDYKHGKALERNQLVFTKSNYSEGALDGYLETYLTLPDLDTTLLYSLNFQNGALQGESKAFHINGKIAKRGFFLNGQPIDDYEAYDSLGTKYHYVKFLYSYPIEEKIWEENELSVRYTFDWKDSIYFRPTDITSSQSLDKVLSDHGIGMEYYSKPYYGRPSLVNKCNVNYHLTKYYPNDTIARDGGMSKGKKKGLWKYYDYYGKALYEVNYFDSVIKLNDSISFNSKGIYSQLDTLGNLISKSYIIEKYEKYDCSHSDHYEIRQFYTFWEKPSANAINGYVKNHYDNGTLQSEGLMKNGLPTGVWKFYDPYGKLNQVGTYVNGKRDGRWLGGDLSKTKYLGDICLNPNLPDIEETIKVKEKLLDIIITNYHLGKSMNREFYDVDWSEVEKEDSENEGGDNSEEPIDEEE